MVQLGMVLINSTSHEELRRLINFEIDRWARLASPGRSSIVHDGALHDRSGSGATHRTVLLVGV